MREKNYNKRRKPQSFYIVSLSITREANTIIESTTRIRFHYASRILTSNHSQSTIPTPEKETKAPTLGSFVNIS